MLWYNEYMKENCFYCDALAIYMQPDKDTGKIVPVCKEDFLYARMG